MKKKDHKTEIDYYKEYRPSELSNINKYIHNDIKDLIARWMELKLKLRDVILKRKYMIKIIQCLCRKPIYMSLETKIQKSFAYIERSEKKNYQKKKN